MSSEVCVCVTRDIKLICLHTRIMEFYLPFRDKKQDPIKGSKISYLLGGDFATLSVTVWLMQEVVGASFQEMNVSQCNVL